MLKHILSSIMISISLVGFAQDIIINRNGDEIKAKVLEITPNEVKYKKHDYLTGPTITIVKQEVFMIKYANGTKDVFKLNTINPNSGQVSPISNDPNSREIKSGTPINIELVQTLNSQQVTAGQIIDFRIKSDVTSPEGIILIKSGELLQGTIVSSEKAKFLGQQGKLGIQVSTVKAIDGQQVQLSGNISAQGQDKTIEAVGIGALLFWPALFIKGKEAEIPAGSVFTTSVAQTIVIQIN